MADRDLGNVGPISDRSVEALRARGVAVPIDPPWPRQVTHHDLQTAQLTIAVKEAEHRPLLRTLFPGWEDRVRYWAVHDLDQAPAEQALSQLDDHVHELLRELSRAEGTLLPTDRTVPSKGDPHEV